MSALAALIWLPEKQIPRSEDFDPGHLTLEDAVDRAEAEEPEHPGEMPWIKTQDDTILGFAEKAYPSASGDAICGSGAGAVGLEQIMNISRSRGRHDRRSGLPDPIPTAFPG
jgi:hypothetical protein